MVNFNDIPEGGSSNLKFGINELTLASIVRQEGDPDKRLVLILISYSPIHTNIMVKQRR